MDFPSWGDAWAGVMQSGDPALLLATITHPEVETVRLVLNTDDVESRGETYSASWFEVDWVQDDSSVPKSSFSFPNVDRKEIGQRYFQRTTPAEVTLEVIAASLPDDPLARVARLQLRSLQLDPLAVTGQLMGKDHSSEPLGSIVVLPGNFPGLYRRTRKV